VALEGTRSPTGRSHVIYRNQRCCTEGKKFSGNRRDEASRGVRISKARKKGIQAGRKRGKKAHPGVGACQGGKRVQPVYHLYNVTGSGDGPRSKNRVHQAVDGGEDGTGTVKERRDPARMGGVGSGSS